MAGVKTDLLYSKVREHNDGIGLLRIVAVVYVLVYCFLDTGGITAGLQENQAAYKIIWFVQILTYCSINIFGLISGYVNCCSEEKKNKPERLIIYSLEVLFYSAAGTLIAGWLSGVHADLIELPIYFYSKTYLHAYWFFAAYVILFLVMPLLNKGIRTVETGRLAQILPVLFFVSLTMDRFIMGFLQYNGFSPAWLMFLYTAGAFLRRTRDSERFSSGKLIVIISELGLITWTWKICHAEIHIFNTILDENVLCGYASPTVLGIALCHVVLFAKIKLPGWIKAAVQVVSSSVFGVCLLILHPLIIKNVLSRRFTVLAARRISILIPKILLYVILFLIFAVTIDQIRRILFQKLKVNESISGLLYGPDRIKMLKGLITPAYWLCFLFAVGFLMWKCPYGYGYTDETAYIAIPYRIFKWGDGLLGQEWYQIQLFSFLMLPLYWIYGLFQMGMEGIVLNFRYIFTFLWGCSALFYYYRLRNYNNFGAAAASLVILLYTPFAIMALSYNSLGIMMLLNACIIGMTAVHWKKIQFFISGLFFAGAVLCCPFLIILFVIYFITVSVALMDSRGREDVMKWGCFLSGILMMLILFSVFVLSRTGLNEVIRNLPYILDDPGHGSLSFLHKTSVYFSSLWNATDLTPFLWMTYIFLFLFSLRFRKLEPFCFFAVCLLGVIFLLDLNFNFRLPWINIVMLPATLPGLFIAVHAKNDVIRKILHWLLIPGIIFTFCLNYSSDQELFAISSAASIATFASILVMAAAPSFSGLFESNAMKRTAVVFICVLFSVQLISEQVQRANNVFWENGMSLQTVYAERGPEKGIRMTEERLAYYDTMLDEVESLCEDTEIRQILFLMKDSLPYLICDKEVASFSPYLPDVSPHTINKLDRYFDLNPQKMPDAVFIPAENAWYLSHYENMGYTVAETAGNNFILKRSK